MPRTLLLSLGILGLAGAAPAASGHDARWIHLSVDGGPEDERVRINVPLRLVETVLPLIEREELGGGKIRIDDHELDRTEIAAILRAVGEAQDGDYVTVDERDGRLRVAKRGKMLVLKAGEGEGSAKEQDIQVPVAVLSALVSGKEDELDLLAAVRALGDHHRGDLLTVNDADGTTVRIWIDDSNAAGSE
jgi:hypothetical protein